MELAVGHVGVSVFRDPDTGSADELADLLFGAGRVLDEERPGPDVVVLVPCSDHAGEHFAPNLLRVHRGPCRQPRLGSGKRGERHGVFGRQVVRLFGEPAVVEENGRADHLVGVRREFQEPAERPVQALDQRVRSDRTAARAVGLHDDAGHPRDLPHRARLVAAPRPGIGGA
jgi:hypothetical protein